MTSSSRLARGGLFLLIVGSACTATVACGRVGLDADGFELDGSTDGDLDASADGGDDVSIDTGVHVDTGVGFDSSFVDSGVFVDSGRTDSGIFIDSGRIDTGIGFDTRPDVPIFDTGIDTGIPPFDTGVPPFDTGFEDTIVVFDVDIDSGGIDTGGGFDTDIGDTAGFDTGIPPFDTGIDGGGGDVGILCGPGGMTCNPAFEYCCAGFGSFSCIATGGVCGGTPISCSSSAGCKPGNVCCFGGGIGGGASCAPSCTGIQLCGSSAECKPPQRCMPVFGGYRICR